MTAQLLCELRRQDTGAGYSLSRGRRCERKSDQTRTIPDFHPSNEDLSLGTPDFHRNPSGWGESE